MSDQPSDILIYAAGFGTRMAPLTQTRPKPLVTVAGKPLIDHATDLARADGLKIHVNAHYLADQLVAHLDPDIAVHVEQPVILDSGGGLKHALPKMSGETVMTLNSDAVWAGANPLQVLRKVWRPEIMDALLLLIPARQSLGPVRGEKFLLDGTRLVRDASGHTYTGAQILKRKWVEAVPDHVFSIWRVWEQLFERGTIHGCVYDGKWADVGTPEAIGLAEEMLNV